MPMPGENKQQRVTIDQRDFSFLGDSCKFSKQAQRVVPACKIRIKVEEKRW